MKKCPSCEIYPVCHDGSNANVFCSNCGRTTMSYTSLELALNAWENGIIKTKEQLKAIWSKTQRDIRNYRPYYVPPNAMMNFTNNNLPPPDVEYENEIAVLDRKKVLPITGKE